MRALSRTEGSLKWWFIACILAVAIGVGFMVFNQWATTQDKYTAQANAETLAKDIGTVCATEGKFVLNNRDLCDKGEDVLANPTEAIPGPAGKDGKNGIDGKDGVDGKNGADSTVPGPAGKDGVDGKNGADSTVPGPAGKDGVDGQNGTNGTNGADSTVPGPAGQDGKDGQDGVDGKDGADGSPPSSFTWTDSKTGTKYTCVPDPVGSTTYSCTAEEKNPPPTVPLL